MASSSAGISAESLARMLSDGKYSDFTITCADGRQTFRAHRVILSARSEFFKRLCGSSFKEGLSSTVDLPEEPSLIARILAFIYTGTYSTQSLYHIMPDIEIEQFKMVVDVFGCEERTKDSWWKIPIIDMHMYALADKYGIPDLVNVAKARFLRGWMNIPVKEDFGSEEYEEEREFATAYEDWIAKGNDKVIRVLYAMNDQVPDQFRFIILEDLKYAIEDTGAIQNTVTRATLREVPQFAADIATFQLSKGVSECSKCSAGCRRLFRVCQCGSLLGCTKEECKRAWVETSFCTDCAAFGSIAYPKLGT